MGKGVVTITDRINIGNLLPYKTYYTCHKQASKAWREGKEFVLESKGHCLDGLLVSANIFDKTDSLRLYLSHNKGKFIQVNGL